MNEQNDDVTIGDEFGRLGWIRGFDEACFELRDVNRSQRLWFRYLGEPLNWTYGFSPSSFPAWEWTISNSLVQSSISLAPAREQCVP
jgi:hypothetical protein